MKKKICCIFNTPSLYRELIYKRIEESYDCSWYFETTDNKLKTFDTNQFKDVTFLPSKQYKGFYTVQGLVPLLWREEYDIFLMMGHSRNLSSFIFLLLKKFFRPKKKAFLWTHGLYGKENKIEYLYKSALYNLADGIFLYGDYARQLMIEKGFRKEKLFTLHNSLNYDEQLRIRQKMVPSPIYHEHFGNALPTLIFIGRLTPVKQLEMLIQAISSLAHQSKHYNLVFVGDGSIRASLEKQAKEGGIEHQTWFFGACYDEKKNAELVYNADLCVAPGNVGLTAIHALMFGCPVISHNKFSLQMPEFEAIKDGQTGCFFQYSDHASLTATIESWFTENGGKRESIRKACYHEIDTQWNPNFQMSVIQSALN